jgi:hypothetical protein
LDINRRRAVPEIGDNTKISMNLKFLISIFVVISLGIGGYYKIIGDIKDAAGLPKPPVTRVEFDLKTNRYAELIKDLQEANIELEEDYKDLKKEVADFKETYYENR